jgi:hypothetical protein
MIYNRASDQRRNGRGTVEARQRRRMHPTVLALEDRRLLSTFTVTSTLDNGSVGSLRWAVGQANSAGGAETIAFDKTVFKTPQTITLSGTQLELSDTTATETITGPKAGVTVSGGGLSRVSRCDPGVTATISGLTITGGVNERGGGVSIYAATVALTNCTVNANQANGATALGGGIYALDSTVNLQGCTVTSNQANGTALGEGGGIYGYGGVLTLVASTVKGNNATTGYDDIFFHS